MLSERLNTPMREVSHHQISVVSSGVCNTTKKGLHSLDNLCKPFSIRGERGSVQVCSFSVYHIMYRFNAVCVIHKSSHKLPALCR